MILTLSPPLLDTNNFEDTRSVFDEAWPRKAGRQEKQITPMQLRKIKAFGHSDDILTSFGCLCPPSQVVERLRFFVKRVTYCNAVEQQKAPDTFLGYYVHKFVPYHL